MCNIFTYVLSDWVIIGTVVLEVARDKEQEIQQVCAETYVHLLVFLTWAVVTEQRTSPRCALIILPKAVITSPVRVRRPLSDKTSAKQNQDTLESVQHSCCITLVQKYILFMIPSNCFCNIYYSFICSKVYLHQDQYQHRSPLRT